jgi:BirA family biotin operon repressor/biotin-[acetyl-CoA-carboxylase] ligase
VRLAGIARLRATRSTNDLLLALSPEASHGWVVLADAQTGGRGRHGRPWCSPPGTGLYLSIGWLYPELGRAGLGPLSLRVGLLLAERLAPWGGGRLCLKWPNDLLAGGEAKLGGVLVETRTADGGTAVVVGVGVNVLAAPGPALTAGQATACLAELAGPVQPTVEDVAVAVITGLTEVLAGWEAGGPHDWLPRWRALDALAGQRIAWTEAGRRCEGVADGPDASGALRVLTPAGPRLIVAGEIEQLRAAQQPEVLSHG